MKQKLLLSILLIFLTPVAWGLTFKLPPKGDSLIGKIKVIEVRKNETFEDVARRYDMGYYELVEANPNINTHELAPGTVLVIPQQYVLPNVPHKGIVINLAEMRLFYFPPGKKVVETFPIGIGRQGWQTPLGMMKIIQRKKNPSWFVPTSIRKARAEEGVFLPKVVPPGPENPLGNYALRLSQPSYLIHGTNQPEGVGRRSSAGCIRLYPEDIKQLYEQIALNAPVNIVDNAYKLGWDHNKLYLEAHLPLQENDGDYSSDGSSVIGMIDKVIKNKKADVDWTLAQAVAKEETGVPEQIGHIV